MPTESHRAQGGNPSCFHSEGITALQTKERRVITMITYQDLFMFCTFVVTLISLLCQIFRGRK